MGYVEKILHYYPKDSTNNSHNGWSTYETWLLIVHDDGNMFDDYTQQAWTDIQKTSSEYETEQEAVQELLNRIADYTKEAVNELLCVDEEKNLLKRDLLVSIMNRVNWHEIAMHYIDNVADQNFPLWKRAEATHSVHSEIPGRLPDNSQWFENEKLAIEYIINNSIVTEIHPKRYEVTWRDQGAVYAVWIENAEPGTYMNNMC